MVFAMLEGLTEIKVSEICSDKEFFLILSTNAVPEL